MTIMSMHESTPQLSGTFPSVHPWNGSATTATAQRQHIGPYGRMHMILIIIVEREVDEALVLEVFEVLGHTASFDK